MYLCTPVDPASGKETFVAKVLATPYPVALHEELGMAEFTPKLLGVDTYPGGVSVVRMAYLDPAEGWVSLCTYRGDVDMLEKLAETAMGALHKCLDCAAVHGDLGASNLFVR